MSLPGFSRRDLKSDGIERVLIALGAASHHCQYLFDIRHGFPFGENHTTEVGSSLTIISHLLQWVKGLGHAPCDLKTFNQYRVNRIQGGLNGSMQHHLTHHHGGGGANEPSKTDQVEPAGAPGTVGAVEGRGGYKRYWTGAGQGQIVYSPVAGLTRRYRPTGTAALGVFIVDSGARSDR